MIAKAEWDFSAVSDPVAACGYEYSRELSGMEESTPWVALSSAERKRLTTMWRRSAETRVGAAIRVICIDEATDWLAIDPLRNDDRQPVSLLVSLGSYSDTELTEEFRRQLPNIRAAAAKPRTERKGQRTTAFAARLDNLAFMRLRAALSIGEIMALLAKHPLRFWSTTDNQASVRERIDERRKRCRRHFSKCYPKAGKPIHWKTLLEQ